MLDPLDAHKLLAERLGWSDIKTEENGFSCMVRTRLRGNYPPPNDHRRGTIPANLIIGATPEKSVRKSVDKCGAAR